MLNSVRFDWFSFTLKSKSLEKVMFDLGLKSDDFELCSFGRYGYRSMITHIVYDICLMFDGTEEMGIHVVVSGGSIKYFMECFLSVHGEKTPFGTFATSEFDDEFKQFTKYVLTYGSFSRVDVNIDTDMPFMNPYHLRDMARDGDMITYYRSWKMYENSDGSGTFYLGKRGSSSFIRVYDKAKEQGDFDSTLYRFEVQFNKFANDFMRNFLHSGLCVAFASFIENQLRFTPCADYFSEPYLEWKEFVELVRNGYYCILEKYKAKKRKNTLNSLYHMFNQYKIIIGNFFSEYGNIDDFIEFMFNVADSDKYNCERLYQFIASKGWEMP